MKPILNNILVSLIGLSALIFSYGLWVTGYRLVVLVWIVALVLSGIRRAVKINKQKNSG